MEELVGKDILKTTSLRANFFWTLAGNSIYGASQWGIIILLSKLGTTEIVGKFALAVAITAPVIIFSNLSLRAVQATDASKTYEFGHCAALRLITIGLAFTIIIGIVLVMQYPWDTSMVILAVGLAKSIESVSDVIYGLFQQNEWMSRISISMILKGLLSILCVAAGLILGKNLIWGMIGLVTASGITLFLYDLPVGKMLFMREQAHLYDSGNDNIFKPVWNREKIFQLAKITLPLGIATSMISFNINIPRYFLERSYGENYLGIFAALTYPLTIGILIINALGQSAAPRLAKFFESREIKNFRGLLLSLSGWGFLLGLVSVILVLFFGHQFLTLAYQAEYALYEREFIFLSIIACIEFTFTFLGYGMTAAHYYKIQPVIYFISTLLTIYLGFTLIPTFGIMGAIQVTFITTCFRALAMLGVNIYALQK